MNSCHGPAAWVCHGIPSQSKFWCVLHFFVIGKPLAELPQELAQELLIIGRFLYLGEELGGTGCSLLTVSSSEHSIGQINYKLKLFGQKTSISRMVSPLTIRSTKAKGTASDIRL